MREHESILLDQFNGLWNRGDVEEVPLDHFTESNNLKFIGSSGFGTRDGIAPHQNVAVPLANVLRMFNYPTEDKSTLLVLTTGGAIYHVVSPTLTYGPILSIPTMTDFSFVPYAGRAYITPYTTEVVNGLNRERGLPNEFVYVYLGAGAVARKAAGQPPTTSPAINVANGIAGNTDFGVHVFGVVYETDTGYLSAPGALSIFYTDAARALDFSAIPVSPSAAVVKRHIVASTVINNFNGDLTGYQLFFLPSGTISNNTATTLAGISFFDADLIDDASHLFDNFAEIPAGVKLATYHNRMCSAGEYNNISLIRVSALGEPEAISQIDGLCVVPPNGDPITNITELRDVLYAFKRNKTCSFVDNGDVPSSWPYSGVDTAMGCGVNGLGTVLDTGGSNIDYLIVGTYTGIVLFNGRYMLPELSWKIASYWNVQSFKNNNRRIQIVNDALLQRIYAVTTDRKLLYADYSNGFDPKKIKWCPWSLQISVNSIALINVNELIIGCDRI